MIITFYQQNCDFSNIDFLKEAKNFYKNININSIELIKSELNKRIFKVYYD